MNIAIFCIFIASILPIAFVAVAKLSGGFKLGHNHNPRKYLSSLEGRANLAKCAHDNSWEAFAPFGVAVALCLHVNVNQTLLDQLSASFVIFRIFYGVLYILDRPTLRSIIWSFAFFIVIYLYYLAWSA